MPPPPSARSIWQRLAVPRDAVRDALGGLFEGLDPATPIVVHSDLLRLGAPGGPADPALVAPAWLDLLREAAAGRPLLVPSFAYDFCRTGRYAPATDPAQVGALARHAVERHAGARTLTPVFNFCIFDNAGLPLGADPEPFGATGLFAELHRRNALVVFLGTGMLANTFIHYVEERLAIGYRYPKTFPGVIETAAGRQPIALTFRVRPRRTLAVEYGDLGEAALAEAGRLRRAPVGLGQGLAFRTEDYWRIVGGAMAEDELHVLTPRSAAVTRALYAEFGRPLTREALEGG